MAGPVAGDARDFTRKIDGTSTYVYRNGEIILKKNIRKVKFISEKNKNFFRSSNFITLDIETRTLQNGEMEPYCVCLCIPSTLEHNQYAVPVLDKISFYLSDYKDSDTMLKEAIKYILKPKYSNYKVYIHNFSYRT